jgi:hypothetical protein
MPHGGAAAKVRTTRAQTHTRTPAGAAPLFAGMPPGDEKALVPGVPQVDVAPVTPPSPLPAAPTTPAAVVAAEPVAAMEPMSEGGPVGLLALIAAVCVLGVGIAAIRAFVSQRANRARIA